MGKQGKSSATSATRKKHQKKANPLDPSISIAPAANNQGKGKGKGKNKEPRIKQYIPPPKFKPLVEDPIDGLATTGALSPNMVLCFKGLSKKDPVTKTKALEELGMMLEEESWAAALPVWLWHFVPLSVHPSRRIRELNASLHLKIISLPGIRDELQTFLLSHSSAGSLLAAWIMGANDVVAPISASLRSSWNGTILWRSDGAAEGLLDISDHIDDLVSAVIQSVVEPDLLYQQFAPLAAVTKDNPDQSDISSAGEHQQDRAARLRISGLGALGWMLDSPSAIALPQLLPALTNMFSSVPPIGSMLCPTNLPPFLSHPMASDDLNTSVPLGYEQRGTRIAGWGFVRALVKCLQEIVTDQNISSCKEALKQAFLCTLGIAALWSAWIEPDAGVRTSMWEGLLVLITAFPEVWDTVPLAAKDIVEDASDSEQEDTTAVVTAQGVSPGQAAYAELLNFLQIGCRGSAIQSYPAMVIVLSTLPSTILIYERQELDRLFTSFWAGYDGNTLNVLPRTREPVFKSFLSAFLECVVFVCRKLSKDLEFEPSSAERKILVESVVTTWIGLVLTELTRGKLLESLPVETAGSLVGNSIKQVEKIDQDILGHVWISNWEPILIDNNQSFNQGLNSIRLQASILGSVNDTVIIGPKINQSLEKTSRFQAGEAETVDLLLRHAQILGALWECLDASSGPWLVEATYDAFDRGLTPHLISLGHGSELKPILNGFLNSSSIPIGARFTLWTTFLNSITQASAFELLQYMLDSLRFPPLGTANQPGLYKVCQSWVADITAGNNVHIKETLSVLNHWEVCLDRLQVKELLGTLGGSFIREASNLLFASNISHLEAFHETTADILFRALGNPDLKFLILERPFDLTNFGALLHVLPACSVYLPSSHGRFIAQCEDARGIWLLGISADMRAAADEQGREFVARLLGSCETCMSAADVMDVASRSGLYADERSILLKALPPAGVFDSELEELFDIPSSVLAGVDPLVQPTEREPPSTAMLNYDSQGFSRYTRLGAALATLLSQNRHLAKDQLWTFNHLLMLQQLCSDYVASPFWPSSAFKPSTGHAVTEISENVSQLVIYLGNSLFSDQDFDWHKKILERLRRPSLDPLIPHDAQDVVFQVYSLACQASARLRDHRLLRRVVHTVLRDVEPSVIDMWADFAQGVQNQHPEVARAIGSIVASRGVESARLDWWRNELASRVSGIPPSSANDTGVALLRTLNCLAPPIDSGIVYLPSQRAVFLVQALQKWMTSDEELDDSLETHVTTTLYHLSPILQTVPGAHWEFTMDILENNLRVPDGATWANLYLLLQTLRTAILVHDLSRTNHALEDIWKPRQDEVFQSVLSLFLATTENTDQSETRDMYHECLVEAIQVLPSKQISSDLFDQLLLLTESRHVPIKKTAHHLARKSLAQITEHRVLESAINQSSEDAEDGSPVDEKQFELPESLVGRLVPASQAAGSEDRLNLLLSWWITAEFFDNSSLRIKQGYLEQLRRLDLVKLSLVPSILELLSIGAAGVKPFGLSQWYIEEYYFDLYDGSLPSSLNILTAHVYYKALKSIPGLLRAWWSECQDKQLSTAFSAYTKAYFTPVLVKQELAQFRSSAASASEALADDAFTLKVAPSVNEISAVYTVDDQSLEVAVRLPPEFPLKAAEVRDVRGIAGMENRRRAWVFGVQQTAQQGLIYDALAVYKKNVTGHFEGKSECAICYSLISVTDHTLPTKPCRTCKNRFHSSCLYKWFSTSHSSTCPLCRSDIF